MTVVTLKGTSYYKIVNMITPLPGNDNQKLDFVAQYIDAESHDALTTSDPIEEYLFWFNEQDI